jgi:TRAP-type C4-dicarboxylate transport system permease small subunit
MTQSVMRVVLLVNAVVRAAAGILLICSVAINFANIIGRYFFHASFPWAEESMLFLMVGCVFLGSGLVTWKGGHIRMDIVVRAMPEPVRIALDLLSDLVLLATAILIVVFAFPIIRQLAEFDQRSLAADFPLVIPQAMVPIGLAIMAFMIVCRLVTGAGRDKSDESGV